MSEHILKLGLWCEFLVRWTWQPGWLRRAGGGDSPWAPSPCPTLGHPGQIDPILSQFLQEESGKTHMGGQSQGIFRSQQWTSTLILWMKKHHSTIIQSKSFSVPHRPFLFFGPNLSLDSSAAETAQETHPTTSKVNGNESWNYKSTAIFPLYLANWIIVLGLEMSSLGSALQCYPLLPLHMVPIRQVGGGGRRRKQVKR